MTSEEIKDEYSMKDVVGRYGFIPDRKGFIPCPFHNGDRQASLKVYEKDFHCHACGANGDIFTFVQLMENVDFKESFRILGGTYRGDNRKVTAIKWEEIKQKQAQVKAENNAFVAWRENRLFQINRLLHLLGQLVPQYAPLSAEWCVAVEMMAENKDKYQILTNGTRKEQEGMRRQDE